MYTNGNAGNIKLPNNHLLKAPVYLFVQWHAHRLRMPEESDSFGAGVSGGGESHSVGAGNGNLSSADQQSS